VGTRVEYRWDYDQLRAASAEYPHSATNTDGVGARVIATASTVQLPAVETPAITNQPKD
jgi:hypothetical protein